MGSRLALLGGLGTLVPDPYSVLLLGAGGAVPVPTKMPHQRHRPTGARRGFCRLVFKAHTADTCSQQALSSPRVLSIPGHATSHNVALLQNTDHRFGRYE